MNVVVKKFGGTSVGSIEKIEAVADILAKNCQEGQKPVVVISAMSGATNRLVEMAEQINPSFRGPAYDVLLASGEQVSSALLSIALAKRNIKSQPMLAHQVGIQTDSVFSKANIQSIKTEPITKVLEEGAIPLVAGFQGTTKENQITTLGRGGSDLTAVALTVVLKQNICEIYTDVAGVFTGDPKLIPSAKKIKELGFSEMMEMASLGSKVLQIRCVEMAAKHNIKIHVRDTFSNEEGTWIINKENNKMEGSVVSAVAHDSNTVVVKVQKMPQKDLSFISELFQQLGKQSIYVDIISKSEFANLSALAFSVPKTDLQACLKILESLVDSSNIEIINEVSKISIIGVGMAHHTGVAGRFFSVFHKLEVPLYLVTTSEIKISAIIDEKNLSLVAKALHSEFKLG